MLEDSFLHAILTENSPVNLYNEHQLEPFDVILEKRNQEDRVFCTNERASLQSTIPKFATEEASFTSAIKRLD